MFHIEKINSFLKDERIINYSKEIIIQGFAPIEEAKNDQASWVRGHNIDAIKKVKESEACLIFTDEKFPVTEITFEKKCFVVCPNPRLSFARFVRKSQKELQVWAIHPSAVIHEEAVLPERISIGANAVIGKSIIGNDTIIHANCVVSDDVRIGERVILHNHTSIGSDGFSFEWNEIGEVEKFPHIGSCYIGDDVEIYPFANIDRGTLGSVKIGAGTKIDHHVHIGHNCEVGKNCLITASVVLCGGAKVGNNVWLGVGTKVKEKITVGNNAFIGISSTITKDVPEGELWAGSPAQFVRKNSSG